VGAFRAWVGRTQGGALSVAVFHDRRGRLMVASVPDVAIGRLLAERYIRVWQRGAAKRSSR